MSIILFWNQYISYLKEAASEGSKLLSFDEWSRDLA